MSINRRAAPAILAVLGLALAGCASMQDRLPYTSAESASASVPGLGQVRFFADSPPAVFERFRREVYARAAERHEPVSVLALSSGGSDGAFGAGFLKGLSESGQRPRFTIVSGVSTGALMAPFVFLGPQYDRTIEDLYTNGIAASLVDNVNLVNGLLGNALVESDKLGKLIRRYVTPEIVDAVAAEHLKGRRLLVVTTNLDAQRSVIWDMGSIALAHTEASLNLFRQVLAASASIPALFPPRLVEVRAGEHTFQEMHVDGATMRQIYVAPDEVIFGSARKSGDAPKDVYILVNNKFTPSFQVVENSTVAVAARALSTVLKQEGHNNVTSAYAYASARGIGFHIAALPDDAPEIQGEDAKQQFDTTYMRQLFAIGEARGRRPSPWSSSPTLSSDVPPPDLTASR